MALVTQAVWSVNLALTVTVYDLTSPMRLEAMNVTVVPEPRLIRLVVALVSALFTSNYIVPQELDVLSVALKDAYEAAPVKMFLVPSRFVTPSVILEADVQSTAKQPVPL